VSVTVGRAVAAVLLPPFAVYRVRGGGRDFAVGSVLTVLGFLPGVAYALWAITRHDAG